MSRCALCPGTNTCIAPDGPSDADILLVGEAPGFNENKRNQVFIGKTGEELNRHYLPLAGLRRDRVMITNAIRCLPISAGGKLDPKRTKDRELLECCANHFLYPLVERSRFRVLVPLGSFACRAICPDVDLELQHGFPVDTGWGIPAFPMYHPALGIHEPKRMLHIRNDWGRFRSYLSGRLRLPTDSYPKPDYREVTDVSEVESLDPTLPLAADTESRRGGHPHCFTYSQSPGTGRLIRAERADLLAALNACLSEWESHILFHNWLYDWQVTIDLGLRVPHQRVVDTMARVFHLGNLPQGLKALAFRELGMTMQDFDDVVTPYSRDRVLNYYETAQTIQWPKPDPQLLMDEKTGLWKLKNPQSMNTKLKRFFTDYRKNPEDKDVFGMWETNWEAEQATIEAEIGLWPGKCISHVPFEQTLFYACRDADALGRLWPIVKRMSRAVRKVSQEHWRGNAA